MTFQEYLSESNLTTTEIKSIVKKIFDKHGIKTKDINFSNFIENRPGSFTEEPAIWINNIYNKYVDEIKKELEKIKNKFKSYVVTPLKDGVEVRITIYKNNKD